MRKVELISEQNSKLSDLLERAGVRYNEIFKALRNKDIKVNGARVKVNVDVHKDDKVEIFLPERKEALAKVVYQDDNVLVVDKTVNQEVEGENGLASQFSALAVHRLDRNTTGLVLLAKNRDAQEALFECFKKKWITKKYICQVYGQTDFKGETQKAFLVKDEKNSFVKIYDRPVKNSKQIETIFKTLKNDGDSSFVECELLSGRTHQIRAHLAHLGHPIIGDGKYGKNIVNEKFKEKYQKLHCFYLKINKISPKFEYLSQKEFFSNSKFYKIF